MTRIWPICVLALCLWLCPSAGAQTPDWEIFGGYSYVHADAGSVTLSNGAVINLRRSSNGWHASGGENVNSWFGAVFDFSGDYANRNINLLPLIGINETIRLNLSAYPFLFGPQFSYRKLGGLSLFAHPLVGGVHARATISSLPEAISATHWAYALGGGADYRLNHWVSARVQADWIRSHFPETLARDYQNNCRVSAGLVLTLGTAKH